MTTLTSLRQSRAATGAVCGALVALAWILFDTGAVVLLVALTGLGALIGAALDRPDRLIALLERLRQD